MVRIDLDVTGFGQWGLRPKNIGRDKIVAAALNSQVSIFAVVDFRGDMVEQLFFDTGSCGDLLKVGVPSVGLGPRDRSDNFTESHAA
jgi:hypothetical protein